MKKQNILIFILIGIILFPISIHATSVEYILFDSDMTVHIDRTIDVDEAYHLYFIKDTNQIVRRLNRKLIEIRPDQSNAMIYAKIDSIHSNQSFEMIEKNTMTNIQIKVEGYQDEIGVAEASYHMNLGKDASKKYDVFYYDIASNIDASISNLTFTIHMPKEYDSNKVKFLIDGKYNLTEDDLEIIYEDNKIIGTLNRLLEPNQTFSVRIELEEGYFVGATDNFNYLIFLLLIVPLLSLIILFYFWLKYGKGNKMNLVEMDEPSSNFDPAEIGYLYKGTCEERDLVSLLIYLANQGYLKIVEHDDGYKLGKENSFEFIKLKEYEKNNAAQKIMFEHLFRESDVAQLESIEYHFFDKFMDAKHMLENVDNYNKMFFKGMKKKKMFAFLLIAISIMIMNIVPFSSKPLLIPIVSTFMCISVYVFFIANTTKLLKFLLGLGLFAISIYLGINEILLQNKLLMMYIMGISIILIMAILFTKLPLRTKFGNKVLGETYGFKQYLEMMTPVTLKAQLAKNSNFYFDMIPYATVLDSLETWISKGKGIIEEAPKWYDTKEEFKLQKFEKFIQNILYTTAMVMLKKSYSQLGIDVAYEQDKVKTNLNE